MKHLRETFTDEEFEQLKQVKEESKLNWHDFLLLLPKLLPKVPVLREVFSSADGDVCEQMELWKQKYPEEWKKMREG